MDLSQLDTPRMLYRAGTYWQTEFGPMDLRTAKDADDLAQAVADGWHVRAEDAQAASAPKPEEPAEPVKTELHPPAEPTRADLEREATALGVKFDGRWGDKRLAEAIAAAKQG